MKNIKSAASVNNPRKIGLWRRANTNSSGYTYSGQLWAGGPSIRFCYTGRDELWLVQVQSFDKEKGESVDLTCEWAINDVGEVAFIEVEDDLKLVIVETREVQGGGQAGKSGNNLPDYEIVFDRLLPRVELLEMIARKRSVGDVKKVAMSSQKPLPSYRMPVTPSTPVTPAPVLEAEEAPAQLQGNTTDSDDEDDDIIPF